MSRSSRRSPSDIDQQLELLVTETNTLLSMLNSLGDRKVVVDQEQFDKLVDAHNELAGGIEGVKSRAVVEPSADEPPK